jgi:hypothetical protein
MAHRALAIVLSALALLPFTCPPVVAAVPEVVHSPVGCLPAGQFPELFASFPDTSQIASVRVYFKSALGADFYYVEMVPGPGGYVGRLPKPTPDAGNVMYYIEAIGKDMSVSRTAEIAAAVPAEATGCPSGSEIAQAGPSSAVSVFSTTGATVAPAGFSGVSSVLAGAATVAGTVAGGAAGGIATGALIAGGAAAAGVTVALVTDKASPSR